MNSNSLAPRSRAFARGALLTLVVGVLAGCGGKTTKNYYTSGGGGGTPGSAGPVSATDSTVTITPASLLADGVEEAFVTVQVRDTHGNPVPGQEVAIAATGVANSLSQPPAMTDANGFATARIASTCAESKDVTVTVNPGAGDVVLVQVQSVDFLGDASTLSAADSAASALPSLSIPAEGVSASTLTVVAMDAYGNPVAGQVVRFTATGSGNSIVQPATLTDATGTATGSITSTVDEIKTITATLNPGAGAVVLTQTPTVEFIAVPANTYYVRVTGTDPIDCSGGTSPGTAWQTLSKAAACVGPGDTVYVGAGTYAESVLLTDGGTALFPLRFVADVSGAQTGDAGAVIVDGGLAATTIALSGADHVVLDGFTVTGSASSTLPAGGISIVDSAGVIVRNCVIDRNAVGIQLDGADDCVIESNQVYSNFNTLGQGVRVSGSDAVVVRNNLVYGNLSSGIHVGGGSTDLLVENNSLYRNGSPQIDVDASANSVVIRDNLIVDGGAGIVAAAGSVVTSQYNDVWNHVWDWLGLAPGPGDISADPLFADPDGADNVLGGAGAADDRFQVDVSVPSPALDCGEVVAAEVALSDGTHLGQRTTGLDGVNDGTQPDGALVNLGYHYPPGISGVAAPTALALDDARLDYGVGTSADVRLRAFNSAAATWSSATSAPPAESTVRWTVNKISPTGTQEELHAIFADDGYDTSLDLVRWSGSAGPGTPEWSVGFTATKIRSINADKRGFDLSFESLSGDAIAVYSDHGATPRYRTLQAGVWSAELALPLNDGTGPNPDVNGGAVLWVELTANPLTNDIALAYADENNDLVAMVWDGTQWTAASAMLLETALRANFLTTSLSSRPFDVAFEGLTGDIVVAWARQGALGFWWSQRTGGVYSAAAQVANAPNTSPNFVDLAAEAGTSRIAAGIFDLGEATEGLGVATWDGAAWLNAGTLDAQMRNTNDVVAGDFPGGVGWVGTSGRAVCVYADDQAATLDWVTWTLAGGWVVGADVAVAAKNFTESVQLASLTAANQLVVVVVDANADLFALKYDGTTWTVANVGSALETNVSSIASVPFSLDVRSQ